MSPTLQTHFADYAAHHQTAGQPALPLVGIPLIVFSLFALLQQVPLFAVGGFTVTLAHALVAGRDCLLPHARPACWPRCMLAVLGGQRCRGPFPAVDRLAGPVRVWAGSCSSWATTSTRSGRRLS